MGTFCLWGLAPRCRSDCARLFGDSTSLYTSSLRHHQPDVRGTRLARHASRHHGDGPDPDELRDLLVTLLEGAAGGTRDSWLRALGEVEKLPTHLNITCNWAVHPKGTAAQRNAIARAVEIVRQEHPYVAP